MKAGFAGLGAALFPHPSVAEPAVAISGERLALLEDLPLFHRCKVVRVHSPVFGAIPIVLDGPEGSFQVDLCRRGESARGVAQSPSLDLFVHNGGNGSKATTREQILAVRALASELGAREGHGFAIPQLSTWDQRQVVAADRALSVLELPRSEQRS